MFVSLDGLLCRMQGRKDQRYMVAEFIKHYAMAKRAHDQGDTDTLKQFFSLYVVSDRHLPVSGGGAGAPAGVGVGACG